MINEPIKTPRTLTGKVVSNRMDKTIVVAIIKKVPHPKYGKYIKRRTKLFAHDPTNNCKIGDTVLIQAHRPISKKKHWVLLKTVESAVQMAS